MPKTIITIEKESFDNESGIPCVKRIVKENDIILYEDTIEVSRIKIVDTKINIFERWIEYIKNPEPLGGYTDSGGISMKSNPLS